MKLLSLALIPLLVPAAASACCGEVFEGVLSPTDNFARMTPETNFLREITRIGQPRFRFTGASEAQCLVAALDARLRADGVPDDVREKTVLAYAERRLAIAAPQKATARVLAVKGGVPEVVHIDDKDRYATTPRTWTPKPVEGLPEAFALYEKSGDIWRATEDARKEARSPEERRAASGEVAPAVALWKKILSMPESARRELTVPALFMIAKAASIMPDAPETAPAIAAIRTAAEAGFPDPAGYAAASYQLDVHRADDSLDRAEALIRVVAAGGPEWQSRELRRELLDIIERNRYTDTGGNAVSEHPKVRQAVAAMLISGYRGIAYADAFGAETDRTKTADIWLKFIERTQKDFPEAGALAVAAYRAGDYEAAQRWAVRAAADDALAAVVGAKLFLRAGLPDRAADRLAAAVPAAGNLYDAPGDRSLQIDNCMPVTDFLPYQSESPNLDRLDCPHIAAPFTYWRQWEGDRAVVYATRDSHATQAVAAAQLAGLRLRQHRPEEALTLFLRCALWRDAARVAERYIGTPALFELVRKTGATPPDVFIRYVAARRFLRENRFDDATPLLPPDVAAKFAGYRALLERAYDVKRGDPERAAAFREAAEMIRKDGELFFFSVTGPRMRDGKFADPDAADPSERTGYRPIARLPALRDRFMRYRAGELALLADALSSRNDPVSAAELYRAGADHAPYDPATADIFRKLIVLRHPATPAGKSLADGAWFRTGTGK